MLGDSLPIGLIAKKLTLVRQANFKKVLYLLVKVNTQPRQLRLPGPLVLSTSQFNDVHHRRIVMDG